MVVILFEEQNRKKDIWFINRCSMFCFSDLLYCTLIKLDSKYRGSPDSTVFAHPGNHTIDKTVLFGDWFSTKIAIYDFWIVKGPFFCSFSSENEMLKKLNIPTKFKKNHTKPSNPYYLVLFENRTKSGTILSETVLSWDSL